MADVLNQLLQSPVGRAISGQVGLPVATPLDRHHPGDPVISGPVLLGAPEGAELSAPLAGVLAQMGAEVHSALDGDLRQALADRGLDARVFNPQTAEPDVGFKALILDATGLRTPARLREARAFLAPVIRRVRPSGRVIILSRPPHEQTDPQAAVAQRALEGLIRSLGKEVRRGSTANLVEVAAGAEDAIGSTVRFLLSPKSAYVSGQVIRIGRHGTASLAPGDWSAPLDGKVALVTGASRGIGRAIAEVLARDGAHVIGVDVPAMAEELERTAADVGGSTLALDITSPEAPAAIADHVLAEHGGVDIIVHNAGITRDRTLARMSNEEWDSVIAVNLEAIHHIDGHVIVEREAMRNPGRVILVSSISGIAGNAGQTNYATSKAGVIGVVEAYAPGAVRRGITINAVAPGFIETQMTAAMPIATREVGRRMNSLSQGGLPVDVAETVAFFADPGSGAVNGNVVRVCGQSLLGA